VAAKTAVKADEFAEARTQAERDFALHQMTVCHEDGLYRHLYFGRPGTSMYSYSLVTWPGFLAIDGDLEGFVFSRVRDMVEFFAGDRDINPHYWSEKLTNCKTRRATRVYSEDVLKRRVREALAWIECNEGRGSRAEVEDAWNEHANDLDLGVEHVARELLHEFDHVFGDTFEWVLDEWDHHFLLVCFAIKKGVEMYRAAREPTK
jgi:hypothetical protein